MKEEAKIRKLIPEENFIALGQKYLKANNPKYIEDIEQLQILLGKINNSEPMVMKNLLRRDE